MIAKKRNGALRLHCDGEGCPHRFVPIRDFTDARELRKRAQLYGWTFRATANGVGNVVEKDFCPADRQEELRGVR